MRISGEAEAGAQLSVVAPFDVSAALSKRRGGHEPTPTERPRFRPEIGLPDAANALAFRVSVELELTMTFMMSINGSRSVGRSCSLARAQLAVDPGATVVDDQRARRPRLRLVVPDADGHRTRRIPGMSCSPTRVAHRPSRR